MSKPKEKIVVRVDRVSHPESPWSAPYVGQVGIVEEIDRAAHGGYVYRVRFPETLDRAVFGKALPNGYMAYGDEVTVLEGNPHTAYWGESTNKQTVLWLGWDNGDDSGPALG